MAVRRRAGLALLVLAGLLAPTAAASQESADPVPGTALVLGGPTAVADTVADPVRACTDGAPRVAGADRFATAVALAGRVEDGGPVYLASGRSFADGLAAGPVVATEGGVLLLSEPDALPRVTRDELVRRDPAQVVVLGGPVALSPSVVEEVQRLGFDVRRVGGGDRYATAAKLAAHVAPGVARVVVATGANFADALAIGPVAADQGSPVLLVEPTRLPAIVAEQLRRLRPQEVVVLGGPAAVSDVVVDAIEASAGVPARRVAGPDRYATATAISRTFYPDAHGTVAVTTGQEFADALAAGPVLDGPLLLADRDLDVATANELVRQTTSPCVVVSVRPDEVEGLTLGPTAKGHATLTAEALGGAAVLTGPDDTGALLRPPDAGTAEVALTYPKPAGGVPAVAWTQTLPAGTDELVARQAWRGQRPSPPADVTLAWQYTGGSDRYRREVAAAPGLTVTAPFRYYLDGNGDLVGRADRAFIADMHARGIEVWPTIHTCGAGCIAAALSDPARRSAHARTIAADAIAAGADGVQVDIEGFHLAESAAVTDFVEELSDLVQPHGLVTSFDFTVMTDTWHTPPEPYAFWSTGPDRRAISEAVDYAILMAYDEFNRFRPAGPVASPRWVEEALRYQLRYSDPDRLLLGVPLYGRVWQGDVPTAVGIGTTERYVREGTVTPDPRFGVDRVTLPDGRVTWAETVAGLQHRVDLVDEYGLAGTASWRLGFDSPAVWTVLP